MTRRTAKLLKALAASALLVALALSIVPRAGAGLADRRAAQAWASAGFGEDRLSALYTHREANVAALRAEDAAAALGIDLRPHGVRRPMPLVLARSSPAKEIGLGELECLLRGEPSDGTIEARLDLIEPAIDDFVRAALEGEAPRWEAHWSAADDGETARALGHIQSTRVLVARALVESARGRPDRAREALEAARRLAAAIAVEPDVLCSYINGCGASLRLAALRVLPDADPAWVASFLPTKDAVLAASAAFDAGLRYRMREPAAYERTIVDDFPWFSRPRVRVVRPWVRWDTAGRSMKRAAVLVAVRGSDPCGQDPDELARSLGAETSPTLSDTLLWFPGCVFSLPGREPSLGEMWLRSSWLPRLEMAVTLRVHALRTLRARGDMPGSGRVTGVEAGLPCPAWGIRHEVLPDGRLRVVLDADPPWPDQVRQRMVTEWTEASR